MPTFVVASLVGLVTYALLFMLVIVISNAADRASIRRGYRDARFFRALVMTIILLAQWFTVYGLGVFALWLLRW